MLKDKIAEIQKIWGKRLAADLNTSLNAALRKAGRRSPEEADLHFDDVITYTSDGVKVQIVASEEYWLNIEKGRRPNRKQPPSKALGKKWMAENNINAIKVLAEITANYKRKNGLSKTTRKLSKQPKKLSYDVAANRLSFVFARSIGKKGIPAKPYVDKVLNDGRVDRLKNEISAAVGREIILDLNLKNEFETIKITV